MGGRNDTSYIGTELPLFFQARNFHAYYARLFNGWIRGAVLEVGAGLGAMTSHLVRPAVTSITACEPDPALAVGLREFARRPQDVHRVPIEVVVGGILEVPATMTFDTIVYVDVLEHIEDDRAELRAAVRRLRSGGTLVVGGPAHRWLSTPYDAAIGHHRRYDRRMMAGLVASCEGLELVRFAYFDCVGVALSLANRWIGRFAAPSPGHVRFWNDYVLPLSRRLDPVLGYRIGKSFVAVAKRVS